MKNSNRKKNELLGMPHGTANSKLRKMILFDLCNRFGLAVCFQCSELIESIDQFSIEHKIPWQSHHEPKSAFFDLDNIAFSHLSCNIAASTKYNKKYFTKEDKLAVGRVKYREYYVANHSAIRGKRKEKRRAGEWT